MKFNLKNRPKPLYWQDSNSPTWKTEWANATLDWFEGFEKELRERLKQIKQSTLPEARIRREIYKEILEE